MLNCEYIERIEIDNNIETSKMVLFGLRIAKKFLLKIEQIQ